MPVRATGERSRDRALRVARDATVRVVPLPHLRLSECSRSSDTGSRARGRWSPYLRRIGVTAAALVVALVFALSVRGGTGSDDPLVHSCDAADLRFLEKASIHVTS